MKRFFLFCSLASSLLLVSCHGLQDVPPPSVTDTKVLALFKHAKAGDGDALYAMSLVYRHGLYGFPKSETRARNLLRDSVNAKHPSPEGCYDFFIANFLNQNSRAKAIDCFCVALRNSEPRALQFFNEGNVEAWTRNQEAEAKRIMRNRSLNKGEIRVCPSCKGRGEEDYMATRDIGKYYDSYQKINVVQQEKYMSTRRCGYCSKSWRRTPFPGFVKNR